MANLTAVYDAVHLDPIRRRKGIDRSGHDQPSQETGLQLTPFTRFLPP